MMSQLPLRLSLFVALALAVLWSVGLVGFVTTIDSYVEQNVTDSLPASDGIVVLTGGSERLAKGLALLTAHKGRKLLISGVHAKLSVDRVLAGLSLSDELRDCCITLGHAADNTIGNAEETSSWVDNENIRTLYLVTSNYHMPRSLLLMREAMPDTDIRPFPVAPDKVKMDQWWSWPGTSSLLVTEYDKFLFAYLRTSLRDWLQDLAEDLS